MTSGSLEGWVYLAWDDDLIADEPHPRFYGHREYGDLIEDGPEFEDASDAVRWWRERGAEKILIRLDHSRYLWAGVGLPPVDSETGQARPVFSDDDPAGRPESSRARSEAARHEMQEQFAAQESNKPILMGARLRQRREAIGMSVQGLAERMDVTETWIHEVESGRTASAVTINQWIDLVWATQKPWPDERRLRSTGKFGWTAFDLLAAAEDIVRRHINSTEQPGSGDQDP